MQAWQRCTARPDSASQAQVGPARQRHTLKTFWEAKRELRSMHSQVEHYWGPVVWYAAESSSAVALRHFPRCTGRLRRILRTWRSQIRFQQEERSLRRRTKQNKVDQVNHLIAQAELAAPHGLQGLYRLSRKLAPKTGKKSIHFRRPDGSLMTDQEELDSLTSYFRDLYRADLCQFTSWSLQLPVNISLEEVLDALQQMPAQKALPPQQAPAVLWKTAQLELAPRICSDFNQMLVPGPLNFPTTHHTCQLAPHLHSTGPVKTPSSHLSHQIEALRAAGAP